MSKFVLTAQLQLQAPRNTRQVVNQMQQQLQNVNVQINPVINNQALSNANAQLTKVSVSAQNVSKNLRGASRSAESFGSALGAAARRFASITLATGFFLGITRAMGSAVGRAVEFEKEMLKISQVTGKSVRGLQNLSNEVTKLATTFGVGSEEILGAARTLSQAGLAADQVTKSLKVLAQTDLAATFDNIADTTEGAVALINQFRNEVRAAGSEAKFLEKALDAINAVSKNFAVEPIELLATDKAATDVLYCLIRGITLPICLKPPSCSTISLNLKSLGSNADNPADNRLIASRGPTNLPVESCRTIPNSLS